MPFQRDSCRIYNHETHGSESGAHNFYSCNHGTHVLLWAAQRTNWHGMAEPGSAAWHGTPGPDQRSRSLAQQQPVAYAVGGQSRGAGT